jgi:glycosidase
MSKIQFYLMAATLLLACNSDKNSTTVQNTNMNTSTKNEWINHTNIYEVNLRQYTEEGTFKAFQKELARLKEMGVKTLWFMPITPIAQKNKKGELGSYYACSDYSAINPEFGTLEDFKNLVNSAHEQGFKIIIDWVANHTGWDHKWTKEHPDWYLKDSSTNDFQKASGMDDIIELDFRNPALRRAMIDAMKFWIVEADIDGFRADLAFWVELDFWKEAKAELEKTKPLFWLGELDPLENADYMQVFDAAYTWTWMHKTKDFYQNGLTINHLDSVLQRYHSAPGIKAWFTTNHDENSWNGTEYEKYGEAAKALAVFSCTYPGIPLIYSGQEAPNKKRLKFFEKDVIEWNGKYELSQFYKKLFELKSTHPALSADVQKASLHKLAIEGQPTLLCYVRKSGERNVIVFLNLSVKAISFGIGNEELKGTYTDLFSGKQRNFENDKNIQIEPWGFQVFLN